MPPTAGTYISGNNRSRDSYGAATSSSSSSQQPPPPPIPGSSQQQRDRTGEKERERERLLYHQQQQQQMQQEKETGPPPRSRNGSVATTTSKESRSSTGGQVPTSHMDSTITRLLVATKQLLEGLAKWSRGELSEDAISAIYVKLGNDFNVACAAFARENIGMSELLSVPSELRVCLESCLSDEPSQATLEKHLPQVRQIIIGLLTGLREKQKLYRDGVAQKRQKERRSTTMSVGAPAPLPATQDTLVGSGVGGGAGGGGAKGALVSVPETTQAYQEGDPQIRPPLTPNSAGRSREDLRKFVSQAQVVGIPPTAGTSTSFPAPTSPPTQPPPPLPTTATTGASPPTSTASYPSPETVLSPTPQAVPSTTPKIGQPISIAPRIDAHGNPIAPAYPSGKVGSSGPRGPRRVISEEGQTSGSGPRTSIGGGVGGNLQRSKTAGRYSEADALPGPGLNDLGAALGNTTSIGPGARSSSSTTSSGHAGRVSSASSMIESQSGKERSRAISPPPPQRVEEEPEPVPRTPITDLYPQAIPQTPPQPISSPLSPTSLPAQQSDITSPPLPPAVLRPISVQAHAPAHDEPFTPTFEGNQTAAQLESLEALKSSDNLSRRASKRYSAYAIQKMTTGAGVGSPARNESIDGGGSGGMGMARDGKARSGTSPNFSAGRELSQFGAAGAGTGGEKSGAGVRRAKTEFRPSRGVNVPPPMPSMPMSLSEKDLSNRSGGIGTISEGHEEESSSTSGTPKIEDAPNGLSPGDTLPPIPAQSTPFADSLSPRTTQSSSTPVLSDPTFIEPGPNSEPSSAPPLSEPHTEGFAHSPILSESETEYPISVYLQINRDVKKVKLDSAPTIAGLRVLFIERFQYNPGHADFPTIYLRDPVVGVQYELEDMAEVKDRSVINLNIDTVEQVKQHIDQGLSGLAQEIKELRSTVSAIRRASVTAATFSPEPNSSPIVARPSERQFQDTAQKMLKMKRMGSIADGEPHLGPSPLSIAPSISSIVEAGPISPTTATDPRSMAIVGTLKSQQEEVQNLRRDIGVLRQVYADFAGSTKTMLASVRAQTTHVQTLAATKVSSSRAFIEAGVSKLETETTDLVVKGDDLQDAVDDMRQDISTKKIRPRPARVSEIASGLRTVMKARDDLAAWITTVKPSWRTTWSDELERIVGEQKLLEAQESLLNELQADLRDASGVLETIQEVTKHSKGTTPRPPRELASISSDAPGDLSTVLLEVQALQPDANKRLEAIAKAERARELENANRKDEFAEELDDFVVGGKLKKSGGIEETERLRQARSEASLRAMFAPPEV